MNKAVTAAPSRVVNEAVVAYSSVHSVVTYEAAIGKTTTDASVVDKAMVILTPGDYHGYISVE